VAGKAVSNHARLRRGWPALALLALGYGALSDPWPDTGNTAPPTAEFHFARLIYQGSPYGRWWGGPSWMTDTPDAEYHFMQGLGRLSRVAGAPVDRDGEGARIINLHDDSVFDYPWLYAVEVGSWTLDEIEARKLREYLLRGGFLMVDDFHGTAEWARFVATLRQVFPDRTILEIPDHDEVMHVLYDLDQKIQIPGIYAYMSGQTWEEDGYVPHWRGIYDDNGRLMLVINFNMDLGDAWEHADTPGYPEPMTALAYRFAVNYVIYAMTH
jgi:hypothetical protein